MAVRQGFRACARDRRAALLGVNTDAKPIITRSRVIESLDRSNCGVARLSGKGASRCCQHALGVAPSPPREERVGERRAMFRTRLTPPDLWRIDKPLPLNLVGTRSTASHSFRAKSGTRWNASLPGSGAQGAIIDRGVLSLALSPLAGRGKRPAVRGGSVAVRRPGKEASGRSG
jgi:hypothetical protein